MAIIVAIIDWHNEKHNKFCFLGFNLRGCFLLKEAKVEVSGNRGVREHAVLK